MTAEKSAEDTDSPADKLAEAIDRERAGEAGVQAEPATIEDAVSNQDTDTTS